MANRWGNVECSDRFCLLGFQKSLRTVTVAMNEKTFASWKESYDKSIQNIKKQRHHFANKGPYSESYVFSSNHVRVVNGCKSWAIEKAEGRRIMLSSCDVGEDSLRVPWTARRSN